MRQLKKIPENAAKQVGADKVSDIRLEKSRMRFLSHLIELRRRMLISLLVILAAGVVGWIFYPTILDFLVEPYCNTVDQDAVGLTSTSDCPLLVTDPLEPFAVRFMVALYAGIVGAMPVVLFQFWRFISPGLHRRERNYGIIFAAMGFIFFAGGVILAFYTVPRALDFLATIGGNDLVNFFSPKKYLDFLIKMMLAFGLGFEFPVLLIALQALGILHYKSLNKFRPYAIVGLFVAAAVLTPSGDPFTLLVLAIPLYIFYEISFAVGWLIFRRRQHREKQMDQQIESAP